MENKTNQNLGGWFKVNFGATHTQEEIDQMNINFKLLLELDDTTDELLERFGR